MTKKPSNIEQKYLKYRPELSNFMAKHVANPATAEELVQDVFLKIYESIKKNEITNPRAYLFTVARHVMIDNFRSRRARRRDQMLEFDETIHIENSISQEKRLEDRDELRCVSVAIHKLPPRTRKAFTLCRVFKYSYAEVAKVMGISPRTVEGHVAKGVTACTKHMLSLEVGVNKGFPSIVIPLSKPHRSNK